MWGPTTVTLHQSVTFGDLSTLCSEDTNMPNTEIPEQARALSPFLPIAGGELGGKGVPEGMPHPLPQLRLHL